MNDELKHEKHKLVESAFTEAVKALVEVETDCLSTEVMINSRSYLLSLSLEELDGEK